MIDPETADLIRRYTAGVGLLEAAIAAVPEADLDRSDEGGWTPRMVVHHLADSETNSYVRLRRLLAEPTGTVIAGYDEGRWASTPALGYTTQPIEQSLAVLRAVRAASAQVLSRLTAEDLDREGVHTESGRYTVRDWLRIYAEHAEDHADQILRACGRRPHVDG
ncbi:MAG: DinB family protein [Actinomycetales bacterium]|nr:DinB family protein [Actinomycetales bacterium]